MICEKAKSGQPLTEEQKKRNSEIASLRCRIEHVFGLIEGAMGDWLPEPSGCTELRESEH